MKKAHTYYRIVYVDGDLVTDEIMSASQVKKWLGKNKMNRSLYIWEMFGEGNKEGDLLISRTFSDEWLREYASHVERRRVNEIGESIDPDFHDSELRSISSGLRDLAVVSLEPDLEAVLHHFADRVYNLTIVMDEGDES
jgi:hypothetical protein